MQIYEYESHRLDEGLPLIFHYDTVTAGDPATYCSVNWHENVELLRFIDGEGRVMAGERVCAVTASDIAVIPADRLHTVTTDSTVRYACLILDRGYLEQNGLDISQYDFALPLRDERLDAAFSAVAREVAAHSEGERFSDVAVCGAVLMLAADLCGRFGITDFEEDSGADAVKKVIRLIRKHFAEPLTLDDLAERAGISKYHLARRFRRLTDTTVVTFLNQTRCEHARQLLLSGGCTVGEAAERSGFTNLSYFTRTFKRYAGCLPSDTVKQNAYVFSQNG